MLYQDRKEAGRKLAQQLKELEGQENNLVIALPRGGVVLGYEIASALHLPLDIVCPRKVGAPGNPEFAIGAVTETGESILNQTWIKELGIEEIVLKQILEKESAEAKRRLLAYRQNLPARRLIGQRILLVDDGLATGSTMQAAIKSLRKEGVKEIILAVPVAPIDTFKRLKHEVDSAVCLATPLSFFAVGQFYAHFDQVSDAEVIEILSLKDTQKTK